MKRAWMIVNAFLKTPSFLRMEQAFLAAAKKAGLVLEVKGNDAFIAKESLTGHPDAALFFDKDVRLAQRLEMSGMRLFNSSSAIAVCDDKTATTLAMEKASLPQPQTLLCPLTYAGVGFDSLAFLTGVGDTLGFPMVVKEAFGSFGKQVYLAQNIDELKKIVLDTAPRPMLFQAFVSESFGVDLRVYVVAGRSVAAIRRVNQTGDFRANIESGAVAYPHFLTKEEDALAVRACRACGADFAGVDLLFSKNGPLVCEVNSNAHFMGLIQATGVNPAEHIVQMMKEAL